MKSFNFVHSGGHWVDISSLIFAKLFTSVALFPHPFDKVRIYHCSTKINDVLLPMCAVMPFIPRLGIFPGIFNEIGVYACNWINEMNGVIHSEM
jgi:hypothetical protein